MNKILAVIFLWNVLTFPGLVYSQFSVEGGINNSFDDNINNNYEQLRDNLSAIFADVSYDFNSINKSFSLYYNGSFNYYHKYTSRSFHEHSAGLVFLGNADKNINNNYEIGTEFSKMFNRTDYSYLDYSVVSVFGKYQNYLSKRIRGNIEYSFDYNLFNEYKDLNNIQNNINVGFTGFLPTKTSLGISAGFGVKTFLNSVSSSGMGQGKYKRGNSGSTGESVFKLDVTGTFSQSIFNNTGLSVLAGYGKNFNSGSRYIINGNVLDYNDMFDDEYNFDGPLLNISIYQNLPWKVTSSITAGYSESYFINRPAYDLNETIISDKREDKSLSFDFIIEKNFKNFGMSFIYGYRNNNSNDMFYNSKNNLFTLKLSAGL